MYIHIHLKVIIFILNILFIFMHLEKLKIYYLTILNGRREKIIFLSGFRFLYHFPEFYILTNRNHCRELIIGFSMCSRSK